MDESDVLFHQRGLITAVAKSLGHSCAWHETHISIVLVADGFAWKFKKAVRFDFLDFSSLDKRRFYCEEELRLNRRYAPDIYLGVVPITGEPDHPVIGREGDPLEYAVHMRSFEQSSLWSERITQSRLNRAEIDAWAARLAQLHLDAARSPASSTWCTAPALRAIADETLDTITALMPAVSEREISSELKAWEWRQRDSLHDALAARKSDGYIRECHGDLHCGNILTIDGKVEAFDCIEFNESMRWIDVMNDVAFTCMDLRSRNLPFLAARLLSGYLEHTGDYEGLRIFEYYEVHRALIRCKVALLRHAQNAAGDSMEAARYLAFAAGRLKKPQPMIVITHGFSGSGKSTLARSAVEVLDGIQLRSDVERKRMHGVSFHDHGKAGIYTEEATAKVYRRLVELTRNVVQSGWTAIVDAAFLLREQREPFAALADELGVRFLIIDAIAEPEELRRRITRRQQENADPSDAGVEVLAQQLACHEAFSAEEVPYVLTVATSATSVRAFQTRLEEVRNIGCSAV